MEKSFSIWGLVLAKPWGHSHLGGLESCTPQRVRVLPARGAASVRRPTDTSMGTRGGRFTSGKGRLSRKILLFEVGCVTTCNPRFCFIPGYLLHPDQPPRKCHHLQQQRGFPNRTSQGQCSSCPSETTQGEPGQGHRRPPVLSFAGPLCHPQVVLKSKDDQVTVIGAGVTLHEALAAADLLKKGEQGGTPIS